jgi:asparagine synthase (glutamine-hydrolysing)
MCGIAGVVEFDGRSQVTRSLLERMSQAIAHRGPDGTRIWHSDDTSAARSRPTRAQVGLVFCRLAILDPDPRSMQPMTTPDGRFTLIFNGEIYNYRELRAEVSRRLPDYVWRTTGDAEVLLNCWSIWGRDCLRRLDGMYAIAVWDAEANALYLARDPAGQKPLYLMRRAAADGGTGAIAFASELPALRALPWFDDTIDEGALRAYLRLGYVPGEMSIYRGARKLPLGSCATMDANCTDVQPWVYSTIDGLAGSAQPIRDADELGRRTRQLVEQAVRRQLVSDVPLGCFLSGGVDSSVIAAAMKAAVGDGRQVLTFSIGFDDRRYDETAWAAAVAQHLGVRHQSFVVRPDAAADLPKLAVVFGEPFGDSSALPTHYLAHQTRQFVKVALSGDGGDELFGGYDRYRALAYAQRFDRLPAPLRAVLSARIWQRLGGTHPKSPATRLKRLLRVLAAPAEERYGQMMQLFSANEVDELLGAGGQDIAGDLLRLDDRSDNVAAAAANDMGLYLPDDIHTKVDRAAMLHGLEVRAPFMDGDVRGFAATLSGAELLRGGRKHLLRRAFAADLPAGVFTRPKMGFAAPIGRWFRANLRDMLRSHLLAADSFAAARFDRKAVERLLDEHDRGSANHDQRLYALLMLELWWRSGRKP